MQAGRLRQRITLQSKSVTRDAYGEEVITWGTFATVWAAIEPISGREYIEMKQISNDVDTRVRIRYASGVTPVMRVLFGSRIFKIISVINYQERNKEMTLMCQEIL